VADLIFGLATVVLGIFILWGAALLPRGVLSYALDPALFPRIVAFGLIVLGGLLFFQGLKNRKHEEKSPVNLPSAIRLLFLIAATVVYLLLWERGSFLLNTFIYLFFIQYIMKLKPLFSLLSSGVLSLGVYFLFNQLFRVRLF